MGRDRLDIDPPEELRRVDALGEVLEAGRGSLPFALVHGEPLVACAAWSLGEAGVTLVDAGTPWSALVDDELPLVLADSLCPLTPPSFVVDCVEACERSGAVIVGVRPVTDTVKVLDPPPYVGATVDRAGLVQVASPVVLPAAVVATLDDAYLAGSAGDGIELLVADLAARFPVRTLLAPPAARRVDDEADLVVLEALGAPLSRSPRPPPPRPRRR